MIELEANNARGGITSPRHNVLTVLVVALIALGVGMVIGVAAL